MSINGLSRKKYLENKKYEDQHGFVWTTEECRSTVADAKAYLKKHPTHAFNIGDGSGWRYGKKYKGKKFTERFEYKAPAKKKVRKKTRGKSINISGLTFESKLKKLKKIIREHNNNEIPDNISFKPITIRSGPSKSNPDGLRILVHIDGMEGVQNNYDNNGKFRIDNCLEQINEYKEKY